MKPAITTSANGFTLIELMVAVAVLGILLAIGIPSFQATMTSSQLTTQANEFLASLASARSEAIKNGSRATVCRSATNNACDGASWSDGWMVWVDSNRNNALDAPGEVVSQHRPPQGLTILNNGSLNPIVFRSDGTLNGLPGTLRICRPTTAVPANENARDLVINVVGRARVEKPNPAIAIGACPPPP